MYDFDHVLARLLLPLSLALLAPGCTPYDLICGDGCAPSGEEVDGPASLRLEAVQPGTASEETQAGTVTIETDHGVRSVEVIYEGEGGSGGGIWSLFPDDQGHRTSWVIPLTFDSAREGDRYRPVQIILCSESDCPDWAIRDVYTINATADGYTLEEISDGEVTDYGAWDVYPTALLVWR